MKLHGENGGLCLDASKRCSVSKDKESRLGYFLACAMQLIGLDDHGPAFWAYGLGLGVQELVK